MKPSEILAALAYLVCLTSTGTMAATVTYSWSGYVEPHPSHANPWSLTGDGSFFTLTDGTPYALSVTIDTGAVDKVTNLGNYAGFTPTATTLSIGGNAATVAANSSVEFIEGSGSDTIGLRAEATLFGSTLFFVTLAGIDPATFDLDGAPAIDAVPVFGSTSTVSNEGVSNIQLLGVTTQGTTVTATVVPLPAGVWLFGSGVLGLTVLAKKKGGRSDYFLIATSPFRL